MFIRKILEDNATMVEANVTKNRREHQFEIVEIFNFQKFMS